MASADSSIPPHNLPHFRIERFSRSERYTPPPAGRPDAEPANQRQAQGERLSREFSRAYDAARQRVGAQLVNARRKQSGIYVEVQSVPGQPIPELTWMRKGVRLGAVRQTENNAQIASVFIPDASREFISESIQSYGFGETPGGNVPLRDRFENLAEIRPASLGTLWTDSRALPGDPEEALWWECWTWRDQLEELQSIATQIGFILSDRTLQFPDILIQPLHGSLSQLELLIDNTSAVEQLRYASDSPVFFTTTVRREQGAWVNNLAERLTLHEADSPAVCLLDTGVARAHPLLSGSLAERDCLTVQDAWGSDDHDGHGTNMSGSILFADLTGPLSDAAEVHIPFLLESVKILPPPGSEPNGPESYGTITQSAVSLAEINAPDRERAFCMAVSNADVSGELPSSWSAAIDQICAGSMIGDDGAADQKRLFFVSAGNIQDDATPEHMEAVSEFPVEDPAQSWNAIAVGGFTNKSEIHADEARACSHCGLVFC